MPPKSNGAEQPTTSEIFNPGQFPRYTYHRRIAEEEEVIKWWKNRGKILIVNGPSKTGKTVLVQKIINEYDPIWIDGHGLNSAEDMWIRVADSLGLYNKVSRGNSDATEVSFKGQVQVGIPGTHINTEPGYANTKEKNFSYSVDRPIDLVAREALLKTERPLVIDDIHFVPRDAQEQIIKALKPLVFGDQQSPGRRVIFISIGNRVINVLTELDDMRDRMLPLDVEYWEKSELEKIASDGFPMLRLIDADGSIADRLADQSFGSPHLMQQLCRELCSGPPNNVDAPLSEPAEILPPPSWDEFFKSQLLTEMKGWVTKLAKGPDPRGTTRELHPIKSGESVHAYQLVLLAVASTGPKLELTKDDLRNAIGNVQGQPPKTTVPTAAIKNLSLIAATKLLEKIPSLKQLKADIDAGFDPYGQADLQPVLEYRDTGATSVFTITDPFFAFYLAWGLEDLLRVINAPVIAANSAEAQDEAKAELEEWGDLD